MIMFGSVRNLLKQTNPGVKKTTLTIKILIMILEARGILLHILATNHGLKGRISIMLLLIHILERKYSQRKVLFGRIQRKPIISMFKTICCTGV